MLGEGSRREMSGARLNNLNHLSENPLNCYFVQIFEAIFYVLKDQLKRANNKNLQKQLNPNPKAEDNFVSVHRLYDC